MPNSVKYNTESEANALTIGNMHIGTGDIPKGPTSSTGFYNGINPPNGGYAIYIHKATEGSSILLPTNDAELIVMTNQIAGASYTTINECFSYFAGQSGKFVLHNPINFMVTDGLVLNLSANILPSYPRSGTSWKDLSGESNNGVLTNSPTFNSNGWIEFDGTDDKVSISNDSSIDFNTNSFSLHALVNSDQVGNTRFIMGKGNSIAIASGKGYSLYLGNSGTTWLFGLWDGTGNVSVGSTDSVAAGRWVNLHGVWNASDNTQKMYINGQLKSTNTHTISSISVTNPLYVGTGNNSAGYWDGSIAKTSIYDKALSEDEVTQNYYQAPIVTDGLVLALDAGNLVSYENGDTTTHSLTGSVDGTLTNGVAFNNANGGTWEFDGTDDYITLDDNLVSAVGGIGTSTEYTLEAWIYVQTSSGTTTNADNIIGHTSATGFGMQVGVSNSKPRINYGARSTSNFYSSTFEYNEWVHVVLSRRSTNPECQTYLNGVLDVSSTNNLNIQSPADGDLNIGGGGGRVTGYFDGSMGPVRVYSKALTADEVAQNYNANINRFN